MRDQNEAPKVVITNSGILLIVILFALLIFGIKSHTDLVAMTEHYHDAEKAQLRDQEAVLDAHQEVLKAHNAVLDSQDEVVVLNRQLANAKSEYNHLYHMITDAPVDNKRIFKLNISAYTASKKECGKSDGITSTLEHVIPNYTCAISRDLKYLLGRHIYVRQMKKVLYINDLMAEDMENSIDLNMRYVNNAIKFGRNRMEVVVLD